MSISLLHEFWKLRRLLLPWNLGCPEAVWNYLYNWYWYYYFLAKILLSWITTCSYSLEFLAELKLYLCTEWSKWNFDICNVSQLQNKISVLVWNWCIWRGNQIIYSLEKTSFLFSNFNCLSRLPDETLVIIFVIPFFNLSLTFYFNEDVMNFKSVNIGRDDTLCLALHYKYMRKQIWNSKIWLWKLA